MKIVAVVPIKTNNERLPGKNTMILGGRPLIHYVLDLLLSEKRISERYIYCSDSRIIRFLPERITFLERSGKLDQNDANFSQIFESFMEKVDADIYIYAHATAPFITMESFRDCLEHVVSGTNDSAFTATRIQDFLWKDGVALNFDPNNIPRSQDLEPIYRETSGIYVFRKEVFEAHHRRIGEHPYIREVSYREAVDINVRGDFELAERLL